jgi:hypothetical protein
MDRWGDEMFKEAYSYIPQSTVAMKLNKALCAAYESGKIDLLNNIHDAVLYQLPISLGAEEILSRIRFVAELLEEPLEIEGRSFRIPVDTHIGFNAGDVETLNLKTANAETLEAFINASAGKLA